VPSRACAQLLSSLLNVMMRACLCGFYRCFRQDLHQDEAQITKAHFLEFWSAVDTDKSGTITKAEVQAAVKKGK
jgi:hypothetical protein